MNRRASSVLSAALHGFLTDYLPRQKGMSVHTLYSYRDSLKLLLRFAAGKKQDASQLTLEQITGEKVVAFLQHLETCRTIRLALATYG